MALGMCLVAQAGTLSITNISLLSGKPQLLIQSDTGITNQILSKTNLSQTNWLVLTNLMVTQSPYLFVDLSAATASSRFYRVLGLTNATSPPPSGMALIPAGGFTIGDTLDGESDAIPTNVYVSAFYMDTNLVNYALWQQVYQWATSHGYAFTDAGAGKLTNNPAQSMEWFDCIIWSNARSQQAGLTPVYYTDAGLTHVYVSGELPAHVKWAANGYRLPTEAEWEKAARGGLSGQRFPLGNTISETQANYHSTGTTGDLGPIGYNSIGIIGGAPYTSPVGSFAPNGYGICDMAGNVSEWCWDWYDSNLSAAGSPYAGGTDPRGPASSPLQYRVLRGGDWEDTAINVRCAFRFFASPVLGINYIGFRCVRGL